MWYHYDDWLKDCYQVSRHIQKLIGWLICIPIKNMLVKVNVMNNKYNIYKHRFSWPMGLAATIRPNVLKILLRHCILLLSMPLIHQVNSRCFFLQFRMSIFSGYSFCYYWNNEFLNCICHVQVSSIAFYRMSSIRQCQTNVKH